jgi:hypothetical protein
LVEYIPGVAFLLGRDSGLFDIRKLKLEEKPTYFPMEVETYQDCQSKGLKSQSWKDLLFNVKDENKIIAFPKINFIENSSIFDTIANMSEDLYDLSFYWKDNIEMEYINNNYLGPSVDAVIGYYNDLLY